MNVGNLGHELADMRAEQERDAGIAAVQRTLAQHGTGYCVRCGDNIEPERRAAMPSARRCVDCQTLIERERCR